MIIQSAASVITKNNQIAYFQIVLDGFIRRGVSASGNGAAPGGSAVLGLKLTSIPAGDHVGHAVALQPSADHVAAHDCALTP